MDLTEIGISEELNDIIIVDKGYYGLDVEEAKKLAKWNRILDEVEEWIADWQLKSMHPPRREDCAAAKPHLKSKHIKKAWKELYGQ